MKFVYHQLNWKRFKRQESTRNICNERIMDIACPTCLNPFTLECDISATHCGHVFHTNCIRKWRQMGKKTCPQCRENCITIKLFFSATESGKKGNALQSELDQAKSEVKRLKSEMKKKDEIYKWLFENNPSDQGGSTLLHCTLQIWAINSYHYNPRSNERFFHKNKV